MSSTDSSSVDSSSSSSGGERDWHAILEELESQKKKVKDLESKLREKKTEKQNASEQAKPAKPVVRRSPRRSLRRSPRRSPRQKTSTETPRQKRKTPCKDSSPIMKRRLSFTPRTRTPKDRSIKRIRKILGLAIKMHLDTKILSQAYRCCVCLIDSVV